MSNGLVFLAGLFAVGGVAYYLYSAGYFNSILDAINKIGQTKPKEESKLAFVNVGNSSGHRAYKVYYY
jgi:hypothetical protein